MAGEVQLGEVAEIIMGQSPPGETYNERGYGLPFFQGVADFNYRHPTPRVFCTAPSRIALPGDILLSVRAPIGRVNVADRKSAIGRGLSIIRPRDPEDGRYIEFVLRMLETAWQAIEGSGSVFGNATRKDLETLRLPWPSADARRAIAHILGTLDDKIELNRQMSETLEAMARALFKAWFVDFEPVRAKMEGRWQRGQSLPGLPAHLYDLFPDRLVDSELGEIPEGWRVGRLGELSEKPQYGYTASAREEPVGPKFLRITDINKLPWIDWSTVPYCEIEPEDFEQYRLHSGDVLIARMADPGHGVVIEEQVEGVFASYLIRFRLKDQAYIRYIQYWLRSDGYWELVTSRYAGTTRASLNAQVLGSFQLIIPPKPVASAFSEIVNALRNKVVTAAGESRTLAALRDALLPKLISGELRVKDVERFLMERGL
jgi:type I restriction enzyme S subunit